MEIEVEKRIEEKQEKNVKRKPHPANTPCTSFFRAICRRRRRSVSFREWKIGKQKDRKREMGEWENGIRNGETR